MAKNLINQYNEMSAQEKRLFAHMLYKTGMFPGAGTPVTLPLDHNDAAQVTNVGVDDHHAQAHAIDGADHTGTLPVTAHKALSTAHDDTTVDTVIRGDVITGQGAPPKWTRLAFPGTPTGKVLQATATDVGWSTNALTIGASASISGSNTGDNAANTSIAATKLDDFATPDNNTDLNANTTNHGLLLQATAPASGLLNVVGIENGETVYANKAMFDATSPTTQAFGDAASVGSAMAAARRDHKHAMMVAPTSVSGNAGTVTGATFTKTLIVNTGNVTLKGNADDTSALTIGSGAVSVSGTNTGDSATPAETTSTIGTLISGATAKTDPVDADCLGLMDSAAGNVLKKLSWSYVKSVLKAYFDGSYTILALENSLIMLAWDTYGQDNTYDDIYTDDFTDETGIDQAASTYDYDAVNDCVGPGAAQVGVTIDIDPTQLNDVVVEDIKASITSYTKDASKAGHFDAANSLVEPGCVVTFADTTTAVITSKTGDGTGSSNITLSVDHATDASLTSITGVVYSGGVTVNQTTIADGSLNSSTTDSTATMTSNTDPSPNVVSANDATHGAAWNAFNTNADIWQPSGTVDQWIKYFYGSGNGKACNKVRIKARNNPATYMCTSVEILGSNNDSDWTTLYSGAVSDPGQNSWTSWYTWSNSTSYDYYLFVMQATTSLCINEIELVEATKATPTLLHVAHSADAIQADSSLWSDINSATVTQTLVGSSVAYHAACWNKGDSTEFWWVFLSGAWRSIVSLVSGTWKYKDAGGTFQNATTNSRCGAMRQAMGIAQNQWNKAAVEGVSDANWEAADGWSTSVNTIDWFVGLMADGNNLPSFAQATLNYDADPTDMVLITNSWEASANDPTDAFCVLALDPNEAYTLDTDIKAWISMDGGANYEQISGLSTFREIGTIDYVRGDISGLTPKTDKTMVMKITTHNTKDVQVTGLSFGVKY